MDQLTVIQQVELFHLVFLRYLEQNVAKNSYALKGGCNLRFFFQSIRHSEDIDFDVWGIRSDQLADKVQKTLNSQSLHAELATSGISIENIRAPKPTETTQRWKMSVKAPAAELAFPTKIEFSRRKSTLPEQIVMQAIDAQLINSYHLFPIMAMHYTADAALEQKLQALVGRAQTQSRDIFDISLLLDKGASLSIPKAGRAGAIARFEEHILSVDFAVFSSQVLAYLDPRFQRQYDQNAWETLQLRLLERLKQAAQVP